MRLYEFTDPRQYLLLETDRVDLVKQSEKIVADTFNSAIEEEDGDQNAHGYAVT
jgi:hypothetical protein